MRGAVGKIVEGARRSRSGVDGGGRREGRREHFWGSKTGGRISGVVGLLEEIVWLEKEIT
jgi:hypothetical protein